MRVKFLERQQFENEGRHKGPVFEPGEVYDFTDAFGRRYIDNGSAEILDSAVEPKENTFKAITKVAVTEPEPAPEPQPAPQPVPVPAPPAPAPAAPQKGVGK